MAAESEESKGSFPTKKKKKSKASFFCLYEDNQHLFFFDVFHLLLSLQPSQFLCFNKEIFFVFLLPINLFFSSFQECQHNICYLNTS